MTRIPSMTTCQTCRSVLPSPSGQSSVNETVALDQTFFMVTPHRPGSFLPATNPPAWIVHLIAPMSRGNKRAGCRPASAGVVSASRINLSNRGVQRP